MSANVRATNPRGRFFTVPLIHSDSSPLNKFQSAWETSRRHSRRLVSFLILAPKGALRGLRLKHRLIFELIDESAVLRLGENRPKTAFLFPAPNRRKKPVFSGAACEWSWHVREKNNNKFKITIEIIQRMYYTKNRKSPVTFPVTLLEY